MTLTLTSPFDAHLHLRQDEMLTLTAPLTAQHFAGAVIMPNTVPPLQSPEQVKAYRRNVLEAVEDTPFLPCITAYFRDYDFAELEALKPHIIGIKLYPKGVTTNSEQGVSSIDSTAATLRAMEELGIPLLVHGETDGFVLDREAEFMEIYDRLAKRFPKLKIVMEHITTKAAVDFLDRHPNIFATVTAHHLCCTLDDMAGAKLNPHFFCKPLLKRPEDRTALLNIALKAHPKLMFGSDSAPHPRSSKECCGCAAGVFNAPIALQILAQLFEEHHALANLQSFVADNAVRIYELDLPSRQIALEKKPFSVPETYGDVVPMWAQRTLNWSMAWDS